jgi:hypothetical protein
MSENYKFDGCETLWVPLTKYKMRKLKEKKEILLVKQEGIIFRTIIMPYVKNKDKGYYHLLDNDKKLMQDCIKMGYDWNSQCILLYVACENFIEKLLDLDPNVSLGFLIYIFKNNSPFVIPEGFQERFRSISLSIPDRIY